MNPNSFIHAEVVATNSITKELGIRVKLEGSLNDVFDMFFQIALAIDKAIKDNKSNILTLNGKDTAQ